jgi:hypothetical protein
MPRNSRSKTPLAVFAYNRARHLERTLAALTVCPGLEQCDVRIFCDGSRGPVDETAIGEARRVAHTWAGTHGATVEERPRNLGLARSIITAVTALCEERGRVIVVEDDLVVAPPFVRYMLDGLDRFEAVPDVYQIAGYMFQARHPPTPESFFLPMVTTWGWATWRRAWAGVDWTAAGALEKLQDQQVRRAFDLDGSYPYTEVLRARLEGQNQSWGILWWWHVFSRGGVSLFPARTLVANEGFDGTGYHCPDIDWRGPDRIEQCGEPRALPIATTVDGEAFRRVKEFIRANNIPKRSISLRARLWWVLGAIRSFRRHRQCN